MNVTRAVAVTALTAGLATTACSESGRTPTTVITVAPASFVYAPSTAWP